ncbi:hypothetical protein L1887_06036 [Cichorium endivia]|nr:hypothetical protein L1887_06036 [Cichorium endivia]
MTWVGSTGSKCTIYLTQKPRFGRNLNPDRRRLSSIIFTRYSYRDLCDSILFREKLNDLRFTVTENCEFEQRYVQLVPL